MRFGARPTRSSRERSSISCIACSTQKGRQTRTFLFYECYRDDDALTAHLQSSSWKALVKAWPKCFEGSATEIAVTKARRLGGFVHLDMPSAS